MTERRLPYGPPANAVRIPHKKVRSEKDLDRWVAVNAWNRIKDARMSKSNKCHYVRRAIMLARERRPKVATQGDIMNVDREEVLTMSDPFLKMLEERRAGGVIKEVVLTGSYRRGVQEINDLDIIIVTEQTEGEWGAILKNLSAFDGVKRVASIGDKKATVILDCGLQVDLLMAKPGEEGTMLLYFTGSPFFNIALRSRAKKMGLKLNERGLYDEADSSVVSENTESVVLARLGLEYIPAGERSINHSDWSAAHRLFARHKLKTD